MPVNCKVCKLPMGWESIQGIRLFREVDGRKVYRVRCGCGERQVDTKGRDLVV